MSTKFDESLDFVAKYYRKGAFKADPFFAQIVHRPWWRRNIAAAGVAAAVLVASAAAVVYYTNQPPQTQAPDVEVPAVAVSKVIEFNDAPLSQVVHEIESVYGVKVSGVPDDSDIRLTLRYEGTASDLIATINDLLGIQLSLSEQ